MHPRPVMLSKAPYDPHGHVKTHAVLSTRENIPPGHWIHAIAFGYEYQPGEHCEHIGWLSYAAKVPAVQATQETAPDMGSTTRAEPAEQPGVAESPLGQVPQMPPVLILTLPVRRVTMQQRQARAQQSEYNLRVM